MDKNNLTCLACGKSARWCSDGEKGCGNSRCDHIHCDHCGMHYSLESDQAINAETFEELRDLMFAAYAPQVEMDIYARRGYKVRYIGATEDQIRWGGTDDPRSVLKVGQVYTVDHTEVHSYHTKVALMEVDGRFTSVAFIKA